MLDSTLHLSDVDLEYINPRLPSHSERECVLNTNRVVWKALHLSTELAVKANIAFNHKS
jgi:hypothetical protein